MKNDQQKNNPKVRKELAKRKEVCPVCTVAVGVGVGLSRWLGIDDLISGIWIDGFIPNAVL